VGQKESNYRDLPTTKLMARNSGFRAGPYLRYGPPSLIVDLPPHPRSRNFLTLGVLFEIIDVVVLDALRDRRVDPGWAPMGARTGCLLLDRSRVPPTTGPPPAFTVLTAGRMLTVLLCKMKII